MANSSGLPSCDIGIVSGDVCHKTIFCRKQNILKREDMSEEEIRIAEWRTGVFRIESMCLHHHRIYLGRYEASQKSCCDPFNKHLKEGKVVTSELVLC